MDYSELNENQQRAVREVAVAFQMSIRAVMGALNDIIAATQTQRSLVEIFKADQDRVVEERRKVAQEIAVNYSVPADEVYLLLTEFQDNVEVVRRILSLAGQWATGHRGVAALFHICQSEEAIIEALRSQAEIESLRRVVQRVWGNGNLGSFSVPQMSDSKPQVHHQRADLD